MISDPVQLQAVLEEIAEWPLDKRRIYIANIEKAFGKDAAQQIRDGLAQIWENRKGAA
jgi:hypothetical protein